MSTQQQLNMKNRKRTAGETADEDHHPQKKLKNINSIDKRCSNKTEVRRKLFMNINGSCSKKQKRSGKVTDELLTEVNNFRTANLEDIPEVLVLSATMIANTINASKEGQLSEHGIFKTMIQYYPELKMSTVMKALQCGFTFTKVGHKWIINEECVSAL